jgi:hypothetical protein
MSARSGVPTRPLSRRIVLLHSAGCAAGAAALLLPVKQAAAKMKPASVEYQDSPKGRSRMQQLFTIPRAECLHIGRRRDQPEGLVQILGQKGRLRPPKAV